MCAKTAASEQRSIYIFALVTCLGLQAFSISLLVHIQFQQKLERMFSLASIT